MERKLLALLIVLNTTPLHSPTHKIRSPLDYSYGIRRTSSRLSFGLDPFSN